LLQDTTQLRAKLLEQPHPFGAARQLGLRRALGQAVVFIARCHQDSETRELRDVRGKLSESSRFGVWAPVIVSIGNALEHASRGRKLHFQVGEE
jgi:hypothetical protein